VLALKTGQHPAQGFFAKVDARLNRPAGDISPPNGFDLDIDLCWNKKRSQPGKSNGLRRFVALQVDAGSDDIIGYIAAFLSFELHLTKVLIFQFDHLIWVTPGIG
jgi:hypothetical protein